MSDIDPMPDATRTGATESTQSIPTRDSQNDSLPPPSPSAMDGFDVEAAVQASAETAEKRRAEEAALRAARIAAEVEQSENDDWQHLLWLGYPLCWEYVMYCERQGIVMSRHILQAAYNIDEGVAQGDLESLVAENQ